MSPPCQPFTTKGLNRDLKDNRTRSLENLVKILENTEYPPNYLFLENVKNFEV